MDLILASTSPYRSALLTRLGLPFVTVDPAFDEDTRTGEEPAARSARLAEGKARAAAVQEPRAPFLIIGSDQVASLDNQVLGKPGAFGAAFDQLRRSSGQWVSFSTSICLLSDQQYVETCTETFEIKFRQLSDTAITRYLNIDQPFDCAGSIRAEALGIALIEDSRGRDLNTLLGLPLILLIDMLERAGIPLLNEIN